MLFPRKKWEWVIAEEYAPQRVAGVALRNRNGSDRQSILRGCKPGMRVNFLHDPEHLTDPSAIAVLVAGGQQIGNLEPAEMAQEVAPLLASEEVRFVATIHNVGPYQDEQGRRMVGAEIAIVRQEYLAVEKFSIVGVLMSLMRGLSRLIPVVARVSRVVDRGLVAITKGEPFLLGIARFVAGFLAIFAVLVVVLSLVRAVITRL
jgi:hypothetical protein